MTGKERRLWERGGIWEGGRDAAALEDLRTLLPVARYDIKVDMLI
jgi:hypothetical protein